MQKGILIVFAVTMSAGCVSGPATASATPTRIPSAHATVAQAETLWISQTVPDELRQVATGWGVPIVSDSSAATLRLDSQSSGGAVHSEWVYALVAPFPTVMDGVTLDALRAAWSGSTSEPYASWPLWMAPSTLEAFTALWDSVAGAIASH